MLRFIAGWRAASSLLAASGCIVRIARASRALLFLGRQIEESAQVLQPRPAQARSFAAITVAANRVRATWQKFLDPCELVIALVRLRI
jgi:hypothetical protein